MIKRNKPLSIVLVTIMALTVISSAGVITAQASPTDPTSDEIAEELDCLTLGNSQTPPWVWEQSHSPQGEVQGWTVPSMEGGSYLKLQPNTDIISTETLEASVIVSNVGAGTFTFDAYASSDIPLKLFVDDVFVQELSVNTKDVQVPLDNSKLHAIKWIAEGTGSPSSAGLDNVRFEPAEATFTSLDIATTAYVGESFTIAGTVTDSADVTVGEGNVDIWRQAPGEASLSFWRAAPGGVEGDGVYSTTPTDAIPVAGVYKFQAKYLGTANFLPSQSEVVTVVVSDARLTKDDVLQDLATLKATVNSMSMYKFRPPLAKWTTLNAINKATTLVQNGDYTGAQSTLNTLLAHTDGCSKTGRADWNDWVWTCDAQGQLYPQITTTITDLQTLQGTGITG